MWQPSAETNTLQSLPEGSEDFNNILIVHGNSVQIHVINLGIYMVPLVHGPVNNLFKFNTSCAQYTKLSSVPSYPLYPVLRYTQLSSKPSYPAHPVIYHTQLSSIPSYLVYPVIQNAKLSSIPSYPVYPVIQYTQLSKIPSYHVLNLSVPGFP